MADSQETRVLKDINRHLANIDDNKGLATNLSPSETAALNKNVQEIMGNFTSLLDARLKRTTLVTDRAISQAYGGLKDFNEEVASEQIGLLDDVIQELEMNNRFMAKAEHNDFLAEAERETDLNINRRTNDLLEDILEQDEEQADAAAAEAKATSGFLSGGLGGLFGGIFAGKSIKNVFGALKGAGKKVFFPLLIAGAGIEFLRGWAEAGEDASTIDKFKSGIARMASDLTFGLVSKEFFENALTGIEDAIKRSWASFTEQWDAFVNGKITGADFFANILSDLSMGTLSPEQIKKIGQQIEDGMVDLVNTIVDAVVTGLIDPLIEKMSEQFSLLFDDPIAFFKQKIDAFKQKQQDEAKLVAERAKELQKEEGLSQKAAVQQAAIEKAIEKQGFLSRIAAKTILSGVKKLGFLSETEEEAELKAAQKEVEKEANRLKGLETRRKIQEKLSGGFGPKVKPAPKPVSDIATEGIKATIEKEAALREAKKRTGEDKNTQAVQINNNSMINTPADTRTENDDALNLQRSSGTM